MHRDETSVYALTLDHSTVDDATALRPRSTTLGGSLIEARSPAGPPRQPPSSWRAVFFLPVVAVNPVTRGQRARVHARALVSAEVSATPLETAVLGHPVAETPSLRDDRAEGRQWRRAPSPCDVARRCRRARVEIEILLAAPRSPLPAPRSPLPAPRSPLPAPRTVTDAAPAIELRRRRRCASLKRTSGGDCASCSARTSGAGGRTRVICAPQPRGSRTRTSLEG